MKESMHFNIRGKVYKLLEPKDKWTYKLEIHFDDKSIEEIVGVGVYIFSAREESESHMNEVANDIKNYFKQKFEKQGLTFESTKKVRGQYAH